MRFYTENPTNFEVIREYNYLTNPELEDLLNQQQKVFALWSRKSVEERVRKFGELGEQFIQRRESFALQMSLEMGKPIRDGRGEVDKCASACQYYANHLEGFLQEQWIPGGKKARLIKQPLGTVLAIMPWNFPLWQVIRCALQIIGAGNSLILKHSDIVAGTAQMLIEIFMDVFQLDVVANAPVNHDQAARLIADARVSAITMTGSSRAGAIVGEIAGRNLKKSVFELGGSDPYLVLEDADLDLAVKRCAASRLINNGQSCISAKRFFIHKKRFKDFCAGMIQEMNKARIGRPESEETDLGPLAHRRFLECANRQLRTLQAEGAKCIWRKEWTEDKGAYFPPAVLHCRGVEASLSGVEFFSPVAMCFEFESLEHALVQANSSIYGLGGAVFSQNYSLAEGVASKLACGTVAINDMVATDPRLPFGGIKQSGFGRELGVWGLNEFVNLKTITG